MTATETEIDLAQWTDDELREDAKRCMIALAPLHEDSPARAGLVHLIASIVTELLRRSPSDFAKTSPTLCRCGEVFTMPDDATIHFVNVFVPANNVGPDGRIHEEVTGPDGQPVAWEQHVTADMAHDGGDPGPDGVRM